MKDVSKPEKPVILNQESDLPATNGTDIRAQEDRRTTKQKKVAMLVALEKSLGVITVACKLVAIDRKTHYRWLEKDEKYAAAVAEMTDVALDFAESKLHHLIQNNDTQATMFYLRTKGKARGYVERSEMTGPDGSPLNPPPTKQVIVVGGQTIEF